VPVLCLGEHLVAAAPHLQRVPGFNTGLVSWVWVRFLMSERPDKPVRVVFGEPVSPPKAERVQELHKRYTAALLVLAREHGVALNII